MAGIVFYYPYAICFYQKNYPDKTKSDKSYLIILLVYHDNRLFIIHKAALQKAALIDSIINKLSNQGSV